ncbi:dihydrodipicolinate synthase family protein [Aeromicrobium wangtongii]|uniref:Dihydrodipicolinate synthase family protein n=1 Tax=Aeromicrobium wangtongii TaxID=2969247 RepID=A0ABY5M8U3_9ACTN|nr:dihydrodipicolinate synthase family protein [Aeromicrobium wangtongii]MCD9199945.1 dihydrodipicolinate synthase family protein [Aeromicrobium wangtongii]MCL3816933.1 dihydrodipicolinate synthase family protein [Aeromicrobium wangtongii]UUP13561.1 dihydrodipicolinate synthase family protein [Aeromicrobium wangtongii]
MTHQPFGRLFVTPVLPFTHDGAIDEPAFRNFLRGFLTEEYLEAGIALIANPEAGELFYLDRDERRLVLSIVMEEVAGRAPVVAGVVDVTTAGFVQCAKDAAEAGADGLFVFPPVGAQDVTSCWNADMYPEVFVDILQAIAAEVDLPMIIHPVAQMSPGYGVGLTSAVTRTILREVPNVVGWKMTYNYDGYRTITDVIRAEDRPIEVLGAVAKYFHENLLNGAMDGTSSGAWNYALEPMMAHIQAWRAGDVEQATKIWEGGLRQLQSYVFSDFGRLHVRYKAAVWLRGLIPSPEMRAPMPKPRRSEVADLVVKLRDAGLDVIDDAAIEAELDRLQAR